MLLYDPSLFKYFWKQKTLHINLYSKQIPAFIGITNFDQINKLVNWSVVEKELRLYYPKGLRLSGKPAYSPLLLFKMLLLQTWYSLSDYQVE